jgi:hypothetical protein
LQICGGVNTSPRRSSIATARGEIYRPPATAVQMAVTFTAFAASVGLGLLVVAAVGITGTGARISAQASFILTFILGYALWTARVRVLVFEAVGKNVLRALALRALRRRIPGRVDEILPSRERLLAMMLRAQQAAWSFALVAAPTGVLSAMGVAHFDTDPGAGGHAVVVGLLCLQWGVLLSVVGRRGLLPLAEGEDSL